jgi:hypothetical protein
MKANAHFLDFRLFSIAFISLNGWSFLHVRWRAEVSVYCSVTFSAFGSRASLNIKQIVLSFLVTYFAFQCV